MALHLALICTALHGAPLGTVHAPLLVRASPRAIYACAPPPEEVVSAAPPPAPPQWSATDSAVNAGLFVLLHTVTGSTAQLAGFGGRGALAAARLVSIGAFAGVQGAAPGGLPLDEWLTAKPSESRLPTLGAAAPLAYAGAFAVVIVALSTLVGATLGGADVASAFGAALPAPQPLAAGRAVDVLLAAPVQEELFFRAWLLRVLQRAPLPDGAPLALSALLFALWHVQPNTGGALLELLLLGGFLGVLYERSGRDLRVPVATHAAYNGLVLVLGALRA